MLHSTVKSGLTLGWGWGYHRAITLVPLIGIVADSHGAVRCAEREVSLVEVEAEDGDYEEEEVEDGRGGGGGDS